MLKLFSAKDKNFISLPIKKLKILN